MTTTTSSGETSTYPMYCDYSCEHAEFPEPDAVGACRRDQGVWCKEAKKYNTKNKKCFFQSGAKSAK
ncbi:MAG: hypothetical protein CL946_08815 [Ectothiorhodospiraceae bacterium]|nr:hypothetical protein [Ectothiorhodospiraceae bacterium]